ncbi:hypothetical protein ABZZ74_47795 [Streptomyces sp. NPDC006476]|uniref:hypothetical protein n=1 Tax=Streptomyces sp. NPDC006476 TaxID=3157175 RepID=UPI0033BDD8D2
MERTQIVIITVTVAVFLWSAIMVAMGQVAAIASLAPALGLTVHQIVRTVRPRTAPAPGPGIAAVPDQEDGAP